MLSYEFHLRDGRTVIVNRHTVLRATEQRGRKQRVRRK